MATATAIRIDPEFKAIIPPLQADELEGLENDVKRDGCTDCLTVWAGQYILLDGHNRYEICTRLGIPFEVRELAFESRDDAMLWVLDHQLHRRNLTNLDRVALAAKREPIIAAKAKANMKAGGGDRKSGSHNCSNPIGSVDTREEAAKLAGVSHRVYTGAKKILDRGSETLVQAVRSGEVSIHAASAVVDLPKEKQDEVVSKGKQAVKEAAKNTRAKRRRDTAYSRTYEAVEKARDKPMPEPTTGDSVDRAFLLGRPIRRVVNVAKFDADAVAHRIVSQELGRIWAELMETIGQRTAAGMGPYLMALDAFRKTPDPNQWVVCSKCSGTGSHGGPCSVCNASGYRIKSA